MAEREWERGRRYRDEGTYGGDVSGERERDYARRGDERGFLERLREELRSWFGEDDPRRGHPREERERRWGGTRDAESDWGREWGDPQRRGQRGSEPGAARGWGYGGDYGAGSGYTGGGEYGYGAPTSGRSWGGQPRWGRQPFQDRTPDYEYDTRSERYATGGRGGAFRGSFAGLGPRGYQRSDERIREDICERMCESAALDASSIEILVVNGEVTLQGSVSDRYDKRLAEDLTQEVSGVRDVTNQLRVAPDTGQQGQQPPSTQRPGDPPRYRIA